MSDHMVNLSQALKLSTQEIHTNLEQLPYFHQLIGGTLSKIHYIHQLKAFAIFTSVLEHELLGLSEKIELFAGLFKDYKLKYPLIEKDLSALGALGVPDVRTIVSEALAISDAILKRSVSSPLALIGYLYVLEGSMLGNKVLAPHYGRFCDPAADNGGAGTSYLNAHGIGLKQYWNHFKAQLDSLALKLEEQHLVLEGANECFQHLYLLYQALYPIEQPGEKIHVTSLNPEAGNYPITQNAKEISSAIQASTLVWDSFPYLRMRFGRRGGSVWEK